MSRASKEAEEKIFTGKLLCLVTLQIAEHLYPAIEIHVSAWITEKKRTKNLWKTTLLPGIRKGRCSQQIPKQNHFYKQIQFLQ